ncbi:MAG: hypothetical protein AAF404_20910 [Pseudomonadota bacterium]
MERDNNRILLTLEQHRKTINRERINPEIQLLEMEHIEPVLTMIADVRAAYIKSLFELAAEREDLPTPQQIERLTHLRRSYQEVVDAANAMEVAIERGYMDVTSV